MSEAVQIFEALVTILGIILGMFVVFVVIESTRYQINDLHEKLLCPRPSSGEKETKL